MSCYAVIREAGRGWTEGGIAAIRHRLADDPWVGTHRLVITSHRAGRAVRSA